MQSVKTDCIFCTAKACVKTAGFHCYYLIPIILISHKALVKLCDFLYAGISRVAGTAGIVIG